MPKMHLILEGDSIGELRAQAILALDLSIVTAAQAEAKVAELKTEDNNTPPIDVLSPAAAEPGVGSKFQAEVEKAATAEEAKVKKPRGKKPAKTKKADGVTAEDEVGDPDQFLRTAFNRYTAAYGVDNTFVDGPILLKRVYGDGIERIKDVPLGDVEKLHRIAAAIDGAILTNEFKRQQVSQ